MFPRLVDFGTHDLPWFGPIELFLPSYGVLFAAAALVAWVWFMRRTRALGIDEGLRFNLSFYTLLAGILGAKLLLVAVEWRRYLAHPLELVGTLRVAGVLFGGVIAGALAFTWYARRHGLPLLALLDAAVAPVALAQGIGRLGCLCAGCCWGVRAAPGSRWAVTFTDPHSIVDPALLGQPLVPVQLIQMVHDLILSAVLAWLWRRRVQPAGTVFWLYVLLYSLGRGVLELWRGDALRGLFFGGHVSTSQLAALGGLTLAAVMLLRGRVRRRETSIA
jgi:phosphatidylglycerol:prolipoprotein diacylglycerol transferase